MLGSSSGDVVARQEVVAAATARVVSQVASSTDNVEALQVLRSAVTWLHLVAASTAMLAKSQWMDWSRLTLLLREGASVEERDVHGWVALHHAAEEGHVIALRQLVRAGAMVDTRSEHRSPHGDTDALLCCVSLCLTLHVGAAHHQGARRCIWQRIEAMSRCHNPSSTCSPAHLHAGRL